VIAQYREQAMGAPFGMFDFAPVGLAVAVCGVAFVAAVGWRLLPSRADKSGSDAPDAGLYVAELRVGAQDLPDDATLDALRAAADEADVALLGLIRGGRRLHGFGRGQPLHAEDVVVVEGEPDAIEAFASKRGLSLLQDEDHKPELTGGGLRLVEAIVPEGARVSGRSARGLRLFDRLGVTLLGVSRQGRRVRQRVRSAAVRPGDVLLLLGPSERMADATAWLGALPLEGRNRGVAQHRRTWTAIALFGAAVAAAVAGVTDLTVALAACCAAYAALGLVDGTEVYEAVEWKVIVLLACLIPLGQAFERSGAAGLAADGVVALTAGLPTWTALLALMVLTMTLSDFLNNVATALIAAPVGVGIATATGANPDAFLMGVAVASSCAFLTPIGHKNNTIVMGPGGYRFGDYWRMGLPLELLVLAVATPTILLVWPL
jgi:di/tricarboxylate transporter